MKVNVVNLVNVYERVRSDMPTGGTDRERQSWLNGAIEAIEAIADRFGVDGFELGLCVSPDHLRPTTPDDERIDNS